MPEELPEKDMIQDSFTKNPLPAWLWLALIAAMAALAWGGGSWLFTKKQQLVADSPFLQVTNREFSLFLWQNPEYMRSNVSYKNGYLPGFQYQNKVAIEPGQAENLVSAPPEVIFLYHVWNRLLSNEFISRPIVSNEFRDFLAYCKEWLPENWPKAPPGYADLVSSLPKENNVLITSGIPQVVQQAFIGWKNYLLEGSKINSVKPTFGEMRDFIGSHPHYARNFWRNIVEKGRPNYLKSLGSGESQETIPSDELSSFLKVGFFNYQQAKNDL